MISYVSSKHPYSLINDDFHLCYCFFVSKKTFSWKHIEDLFSFQCSAFCTENGNLFGSDAHVQCGIICFTMHSAPIAPIIYSSINSKVGLKTTTSRYPISIS